MFSIEMEASLGLLILQGNKQHNEQQQLGVIIYIYYKDVPKRLHCYVELAKSKRACSQNKDLKVELKAASSLLSLRVLGFVQLPALLKIQRVILFLQIVKKLHYESSSDKIIEIIPTCHVAASINFIKQQFYLKIKKLVKLCSCTNNNTLHIKPI